MTAAALIAALTALIHSTGGAIAAGTAARHVAPIIGRIAEKQLEQVLTNPNADLPAIAGVYDALQQQYQRFADTQS